MAQQTALSNSALPGVVHVFVAKAPAPVVLGLAICDIELGVYSPDMLLDYDAAPWLVMIGDALPLPVASPAGLLSLEDEELILVCPY